MSKKPKYITDPSTFNKEFERVVSLRKELNERLAGVNSLIAHLEENSELPGEVEAELGELKAEAANLTSLLGTSQTYADSIEKYYSSWSETKEKIDNELSDAKAQNKLLKEYIDETQGLKETLLSELSRSTDLLNDARKTLDIVTNSSISSVFTSRSNDRKKARRWWMGGVAVAILMFISAVLSSILYIAENLSNETTLQVWLVKLAVVTPFAYILYFVTRQYSHERDLEEKYAFKSLVSQTLQNNTKLLRDEFVKDEDNAETELKILTFVLNSMDSVYREPFKTSSVVSKLKFNPKQPLIEAEAKASE